MSSSLIKTRSFAGRPFQVVASQDWPEVTKYAGLVSAQAHRQELIQDLYKSWHDPVRGPVSGGMIRYVLTLCPFTDGYDQIILGVNLMTFFFFFFGCDIGSCSYHSIDLLAISLNV